MGDQQPEQQPEPEPEQGQGQGQGQEQEQEQGPLSKLTDKAVNWKFVQKVNENVPSSAKPYIEKGAKPAKKTIEVVDKTLQTEEAKRVALTAIDFFNALAAFTLLILSWTATTLECSLQIKNIEESQKEDGKEEKENGNTSEMNRHINKGIILFDRYKVITHTLISKMKKNRKSNNNNNGNSNEDNCSIDKVAKKSFQLAKNLSAYSLNQASQLSGPGSSTIAPVADYIISKLPDDAKQTVQQSTSPFQ